MFLMSRMRVQSSTVEETFVFGSPPLLSGFTYNTCRSPGGYCNTGHECCPYENGGGSEEQKPLEDMSSKLNGYNEMKPPKSTGYSRSLTNFQTARNSYRNNGSYLIDNLNQLSLNGVRTSHVDTGIKILEQAGMKVQKYSSNEQPVFKKRKDLRVLKSVLSSERFREVVMKFGDGDEGGREIVASVHKAMKNSNLASVRCLFCSSESQIYENFPIVDGTLFLTPVSLSRDCVAFSEKRSDSHDQYMGYVCVNCMEGKPTSLRCSSCTVPWNGSFFQIGTLYAYNILSAIPCCDRSLSCKNCNESIIDMRKGEAENLYFSYFSKLLKCPHCQDEDFHFVKSLSKITGSQSC